MPKPIPLPCPCCGDETANFTVALGSLENYFAIQCNECNEFFSLEEMRRRVVEMAAKWVLVLDWIDKAPKPE